jgi:hypothetical protein
MPFLHPSKDEICTNNQVEFYQKMNPLACPKSLEQVSKTPRQRVVREHNIIHGCQRCLTTINCFSNMLSTILKKHNGTTAPGIRPQTISSLRCFLESRGSFRNPDTFHQQGPGKYLRHERISTHSSTIKIKKRAIRNLTSQHLTDRLNDTNKKGVAFFKMHYSGHQTRHFILKGGYLFHQAARFASLVQSNLCLMLHQR